MREQILRLQQKMRELGIDVYVVSDSDEHLSEYVSEHFHALEEFSGFTGGDGKLVVTANTVGTDGNGINDGGEAALWTDGRYFTQAEQELAGSGIELMKMGEPDTPEMNDWILEKLPAGGVLGFDGKCTPFTEGEALITKVGRKLKSRAGTKACAHKHVVTNRDLCGELWEDRPAQKASPCWILQERYTGKTAEEKLRELADTMREAGAAAHILITSDDIAWLLNLRADDIPNNPVFMSYLLVQFPAEGTDAGSAEEADMPLVFLYTDEGHMTDAVTAYLEDLHVTLRPYHQIYEDIQRLEGPVLLDKKRCNYEIVTSLPGETEIIDRMNPEMEVKCCKNETEMSNIRIAQHKDSVALTKFMHWFKTEGLAMARAAEAAAEKGDTDVPRLTEWSAAEKLHSFRAAQPGFFDESFGTISAYGPNAAMAHYAPSPDPDKDVEIRPHGLYLVDSGGQYPEGTTDVTRTWSCGPITQEERQAVTLTAVANLRLADARFLEGTSGLVLDYAAREPFWRRGMNYNHGTGHGVGHVLNVHEAPVGIRYKAAAPEGAWPLKEGMYLSDEPGFYVAGAFGVRIENLVLVQLDDTNEFGRFMKFETVTFCPIDKSCLDTSLMTKEDIRLLNLYHQKVYDELACDMNEDERMWLQAACEPLVQDPEAIPV